MNIEKAMITSAVLAAGLTGTVAATPAHAATPTTTTSASATSLLLPLPGRNNPCVFFVNGVPVVPFVCHIY